MRELVAAIWTPSHPQGLDFRRISTLHLADVSWWALVELSGTTYGVGFPGSGEPAQSWETFDEYNTVYTRRFITEKTDDHDSAVSDVSDSSTSSTVMTTTSPRTAPRSSCGGLPRWRTSEFLRCT